MKYLHEIRRVLDRDVTILLLENYGEKWYCAYAYFPEAEKTKDYQNEEPYVTWQSGCTLGIDTNHAFNRSMSIDEKYDDAIEQITRVIEFFMVRK